MARSFGVPIALPADAASALHATTKQQMDAAVATRAASSHTHVESDVTSLVTDIAGKLSKFIPTATKTANYTASVNDLVMVDATAGPITITLPAASAGGRVEVKKLDTSVNIVTVAAGAGDTIGSQGATSVPIRLPDQATAYQANGTNWVLPYGYQSLPALDARFQAIGSYQPLDTELTQVAALGVTNDSVLQGKAGVWALRTPVQLKADMALAASDVGLGSVANTSDAGKPVSTAQQTALDLKANLASPTFTGLVTAPRILTTPYTKTWASTLSIDPTAGDSPDVTATANTSMSVSTTGATDGQMILVSMLASGGSWAISLTGTIFTTGLASPITIASTKVGFFGFRYSAFLTSWVLIAYTASL